MRRWFFLAALLAWPVRAQLPDPAPGSFDVEPPILPGNLVPAATENAPGDLGELERKLARARESAAGAERLWKMGVLAKVDVENRALRVVRLETELAKARQAAAPSDESKSSLAAAAQTAAARLKQAEIDAASINLERQRKLLALGSGGSSSIRKAEQKLAELKAAAPQCGHEF